MKWIKVIREDMKGRGVDEDMIRVKKWWRRRV